LPEPIERPLAGRRGKRSFVGRQDDRHTACPNSRSMGVWPDRYRRQTGCGARRQTALNEQVEEVPTTHGGSLG
jgi:hypothetical protein